MIERYMPRRVERGLGRRRHGPDLPVCECGVVPVARRLYEKGLPTSIGVAFLLAAPVINPSSS
ncbi:MAG: permease [Caldilineaceae bacterium]